MVMDIAAIAGIRVEQVKVPTLVDRSDAFAALLDEESAALAGSAGHSAAGTAASVNRAGSKAAIDRSSPLYEQCRELETFIIKNLLTGMRNTVEKSELSDGGFAGKMYEDMLWDEYATSMAKNAGFGLAEQAYLELSGQRSRSVR